MVYFPEGGGGAAPFGGGGNAPGGKGTVPLLQFAPRSKVIK